MINWRTETYIKIRRHYEDEIAAFPSTYDQKHFSNLLKEYGGKIIELRKKPPSIREVTDYLGMNDRYAIEFDSEENELLFIMKYG